MGNNCVIVSFSSKQSGNCEQISEFIKQNVDNSIKMYRFRNFSIHPCGGCQYECFQNNTACPYIQDMEYEILEAVTSANMAYYIVPNYCDYPCAHFFIFNERSQCFFQGHPKRLEAYLNIAKRFIVVSNSQSDHFKEAFTQHISSEPQILFMSAKKYGKPSIDGNILETESAQADLLQFIEQTNN